MGASASVSNENASETNQVNSPTTNSNHPNNNYQNGANLPQQVSANQVNQSNKAMPHEAQNRNPPIEANNFQNYQNNQNLQKQNEGTSIGQQRSNLIQNIMEPIPVNPLQENLPAFTQHIKSIKSEIPYPTNPSQFGNKIVFEKYQFVNNTNAFHVMESFRYALVSKQEALKPFMILEELKSGDWKEHDLPSLVADPVRAKQFQKFVWKKFSELNAKEEILRIVHDTNTPDSIKPGLLNDKALQSALCILAEQEYIISLFFSDFNENPDQLFAIWLNNGGEWQVITLYETFPFDQEKNNWAFSYSANESWILILEKAFAKMYGGYLILEYGNPAHYIHDLTGAPYSYYCFDDPEKCWEFLQCVEHKHTTMVAMHKGLYSEDDNGHSESHCYAVLQVKEVKTNRGVERIIQLRNPWKEHVWTGEWSHQSANWTPELKKALNPLGMREDIFWIGLFDFVKLYGCGFSFVFVPSYQHSSLKFKQGYQRNYTLLLMHIEKDAHLFMKVSQQDQKHFFKSNERYTYSLVKMLIVEVDSQLQPKRFVTGLYNKGRDCEIEDHLSAGDYMIYIEIDWEQNLSREAVFSTYGETVSVLYELNCLEDQNSLLKKFLVQYFRTVPLDQECINYQSLGDARTQRFIDYVYGYYCFYYLNNSNMFKLTEKVKISSLFGLKIAAPFLNNSEFDVSVKPSEEVIVVFNTTPEGQANHYLNFANWSYLELYCSDQMMKKHIESNSKKIVKRKLNGQEVDIFVYLYAFNGGYFLYYKNKTNYVYQEQLNLQLINLVGVDSNQSNLEIMLYPNNDYLLKFLVKDILQPFSFTSQVTYKIMLPKERNQTNIGNQNTGTAFSGNEGRNQFDMQSNPKNDSNILSQIKNYEQQANPNLINQQANQFNGKHVEAFQPQSMLTQNFSKETKIPSGNNFGQTNLANDYYPMDQTEHFGMNTRQRTQPPLDSSYNKPNSNMPKPVSDLLYHQIDTYNTQPSKLDYPHQTGANQGQRVPLNNSQLQQREIYNQYEEEKSPVRQVSQGFSNSNAQQNFSNFNASQQPVNSNIPLPRDLLLRQIQTYGNNQNPNSNYAQSQFEMSNERNFQDNLSSKPIYGNQGGFQPPPSKQNLQAQQAFPRPVNDLLSYQVQNYGKVQNNQNINNNNYT